jgi:hypothetical protein
LLKLYLSDDSSVYFKKNDEWVFVMNWKEVPSVWLSANGG